MDNRGAVSAGAHTLLVVFLSLSPRSSGLSRARSSDLLCALVLAAVLARFALPGVWRVPTVQAWTLVFGAVCVQASPYVVLGVLLSAVVGLVPAQRLRAVVPRRAAFAVPVAALLGMALPGCECGSVPLAASLRRRGVPVGPAMSLMLSAPATNPVVLAATAAAFPGRPGMVAARFSASLAVAVGAGWWMAARPDGSRSRPVSRADVTGGHDHGSGGRAALDAAAHDLAQALGLLTIGAASAATVAVLVPPAALGVFAGTPVAGVLALAGLAVVLAVCSEADAFIASSLTQFSATAQLTFMVVGPVVDVKLLAMQAGAFGARFTARLAFAAFVLAVSCAVLAAYWFAP